ncbi:MAG: hypothetical protein ACLSHC_16595 [Bilophila wadsworthia]
MTIRQYGTTLFGEKTPAHHPPSAPGTIARRGHRAGQITRHAGDPPTFFDGAAHVIAGILQGRRGHQRRKACQ